MKLEKYSQKICLPIKIFEQVKLKEKVSGT